MEDFINNLPKISIEPKHPIFFTDLDDFDDNFYAINKSETYDELLILKHELKMSLLNEDYEKAAEIRDKIKKLGK